MGCMVARLRTAYTVALCTDARRRVVINDIVDIEFKAIVAAHPNSQESLWRAKLRTKREQLEELKRMAAA